MAPGSFVFRYLAAATPVVALAATAVVVGIAHIVAAAVAEQQDEQDDPAPVTTTETIVIAHNTYLRKITCGICRSFQVIPQRKKCYKEIVGVGYADPYIANYQLFSLDFLGRW
jgi:hypothetical protein